MLNSIFDGLGIMIWAILLFAPVVFLAALFVYELIALSWAWSWVRTGRTRQARIWTERAPETTLKKPPAAVIQSKLPASRSAA